VSDCDSVDDIFTQHKIVSTAAQASALALKAGLDLNCGTTYAALGEAVREGLITEADIDRSLARLMLARFELGEFDPPASVRWTQIPYSANQSPAHDELARRAARESIVLLKNDGVLPFSRDKLKTIAVIGPTADEIMSLLGNYYGTPAAPVTVLEGIRKAAVHVADRLTLVDDQGPFGNPTSDSARTMVTTATVRALVVIFVPAALSQAAGEHAVILTRDRIAAS